MSEIEIPRSRQKIILLTLGSLLFIAAGYWISIEIADEQTRLPTLYVKIIGIISIGFGSIGFIYSLKSLFNRKHSLIINNKGVIDNSSGVSVGLIKWSDITDIEITQVKSTKFILLFVENPEHYINNSKSFKKFLLKSNHKMYGTPLSISSTSLQCTFDDLEKEIRSGLERYHSLN
ncbi:hypothetical protein DVK85_12445 [Flavobacterium arcticum]|uniref:Uncharacterized protein n=1 Tax=Flavobacterium arcticum TaxID=1784713 RepID=A0A345HEI5_9FLAO|nr:STM3941 family protein [Flavobacterium arcticum]AXG74995.1 hypothetical protein DVK85_12445 [Flavobacterium arcticum]KAF2506548.1 hypothetical protein E0W72_13020 [Flavobacterium arcticum]